MEIKNISRGRRGGLHGAGFAERGPARLPTSLLRHGVFPRISLHVARGPRAAALGDLLRQRRRLLRWRRCRGRDLQALWLVLATHRQGRDEGAECRQADDFPNLHQSSLIVAGRSQSRRPPALLGGIGPAKQWLSDGKNKDGASP